MSIIGSVRNTFGYGCSPQNTPLPGFNIEPAIGTKSTWIFATDGTFSFSSLKAGTCYVITPTTTFSAYVKIWGAGGGGYESAINTVSISNLWGTAMPFYDTPWISFPPISGVNADNFKIGLKMPTNGGAGGFVKGKMDFLGGQQYTLFAGGSGQVAITANYNPMAITSGTSGQGGAAAGILIGDTFKTFSQLPEVAIAGGGGGVDRLTGNDFYLPGAGGGVDGVASTRVTLNYTNDTNGSTDANALNRTLATGTSGLPTIDNNNFVPRYFGGFRQSQLEGGGGGGSRGGTISSGGQGKIDSNYTTTLETFAGSFSATPYYDDSTRGLAGDSDQGGRIVIGLDEYTPTAITATGGTITTVPIPGYELEYRYHTFNSKDTFRVVTANKSDTVDVFVVGGGGGGWDMGVCYGGGGGGVALRTGLNIGVGSYIVDVGAGGKKAVPMADGGTGGLYGGYKGKSSAFYTNTLASRGFPDSYFKLIYSFGGAIRYINVGNNSGNEDGLSVATGYRSFESALSMNLFYNGLIVFIVLQGTYNETVSNFLQTPPGNLTTPINDQNQPRIFVCAPGKVTIKWTADPLFASPMCQLMHPMSAVYGAIFDRVGYPKSSIAVPAEYEKLAFFGTTTTGFNVNHLNAANKIVGAPIQVNKFEAIFRGSLFNCVFRDFTGDWGLYGVTNLDFMKFTIEHCTFVTKTDDTSLTPLGTVREYSNIRLNNCIFSKSMKFSKLSVAVGETHPAPSVMNATIGSKYVVASKPDKGVYAGEFSWNGVITTPVTGSTSVNIVGHGGGGATTHVFLGLANAAGGSGGGTSEDGSRSPSTQISKESSPNYSVYGFPGPKTYVHGTGGSGAGYYSVQTDGGIGLEFPIGSGTYYGAGGSVIPNGSTVIPLSINSLAPCSVGLGGGSNNGVGLSDSNGTAGTVIVRYIVPGLYTLPQPSKVKNIIAFGGEIKVTSTYKEHVFKENGVFEVAQVSPGGYIDVLLVGGGSSGNRAGIDATTVTGGNGGEVLYKRYYIKSVGIFSVTVGAGGTALPPPSSTGGGTNDFVPGIIGGSTTLSGVAVAAGGALQSNSAQSSGGVLITDGLFSDNTIKYGSSGAGITGQRLLTVVYSGIDGSGGTVYLGEYLGSHYIGTDAVNNTGGGGGAGRYSASINAPFDQLQKSGAGGSGILIIRYPIQQLT